jgi:hypothetical protein
VVALLANDPALRERVREIRSLAHLAGWPLRLSRLVHGRGPQIERWQFLPVPCHFQVQPDISHLDL